MLSRDVDGEDRGGRRRAKGRAVVERVDLPYRHFAVFELWELNAAGDKAVRRHIAPVLREGGRLDAADVALARATLEADAKRAGLQIIRAAW